MAILNIWDQEPLDTVYGCAQSLMKAGLPNAAIESKLIERGTSPDQAKAIVKSLRRQNAEAMSRTSTFVRSVARRNMLFGALWCVGGAIAITLLYTMSEGDPHEAGVLIAGCAVVFGGIQFVRGLLQSR